MKTIKKIVARLFGYFWAPCPLCGEYFAGFEIGKGGTIGTEIKYAPGVQNVCCKNCDYDAGQLSILLSDAEPLVSANVQRVLRQQTAPTQED